MTASRSVSESWNLLLHNDSHPTHYHLRHVPVDVLKAHHLPNQGPSSTVGLRPLRVYVASRALGLFAARQPEPATWKPHEGTNRSYTDTVHTCFECPRSPESRLHESSCSERDAAKQSEPLIKGLTVRQSLVSPLENKHQLCGCLPGPSPGPSGGLAACAQHFRADLL